MAQTLEVLKYPSFRYPSKDPDTYLDFQSSNAERVDIGTQFWMGNLSKQYTMSFWIKPTVVDFQFVIHNQRTNANVGDGAVRLDDSLFPEFYIDRGTAPFTIRWPSTTPCILNRWNHVVMLYDTINNILTFVVNGVADSQVFSWTYNSTVTQFDTINLGRHNNDGGLFYSDIGLANLRIYENYLLSVEEAQAQYIRGVNDYGVSTETGLTAYYKLNEGVDGLALDSHEPTQNTGTLFETVPRDRWVNSPSNTYREAVLRDGPKAYWRLQDTSGFEPKDEIGRYTTMQFYNGPLLDQPGPFPGSKSVKFTRSSSHYMMMLEDIFEVPTYVRAYSGELWVMITEDPVPAVSVIASASDASSGTQTNFTMSVRNSPGNELQHDEYLPSLGELKTGADALLPNVWHHLIWTKSVNPAHRDIYIDGALHTNDNSPETSISVQMDRLMFGRGLTGNYFEGYMSEIAVYDYRITSEQVADHFAAAVRTKTYEEWVLESSPNIYFRMDDVGSPAVGLDNSGNNKDATWNGTTDLGTPGLITGGNLAADFDGSTTYLESDNAADFNVTTQIFAVEMWIQSTQTTGNRVFVESRDSTTDYQGWLVGMKNGLALLSAKDAPSAGQEFSGSVDLADGLPHHVVFNYLRGTGQSEIWVDGEIDNTGNITSPNISHGTDNARIGNKTGATSSFTFFQGTIDEIAFYDGKILSSAEVRSHYVRGITP